MNQGPRTACIWKQTSSRFIGKCIRSRNAGGVRAGAQRSEHPERGAPAAAGAKRRPLIF